MLCDDTPDAGRARAQRAAKAASAPPPGGGHDGGQHPLVGDVQRVEPEHLAGRSNIGRNRECALLQHEAHP